MKISLKNENGELTKYGAVTILTGMLERAPKQLKGNEINDTCMALMMAISAILGTSEEKLKELVDTTFPPMEELADTKGGTE